MVGGHSKPTCSSDLKTTPPQLIYKPPTLEELKERPDWLVQEDRAILQVAQDIQGIRNLTKPAQTPNWDLMSEGVREIANKYKSPKACKDRYENVLLPREKGKIIYETTPKKTTGVYKIQNFRPMNTSQLCIQDNNAAFSKITADRFKAVMENTAWRKAVIENAAKRQAVLEKAAKRKAYVLLPMEKDSPLTPMQIANAATLFPNASQRNQRATAITAAPTMTAAPQQMVMVAAATARAATSASVGTSACAPIGGTHNLMLLAEVASSKPGFKTVKK